MSDDIDETTNGRDDARKAVADAKESSRHTDKLIRETHENLSWISARAERNHFKDTFAHILRGGH